MKIKSIYKPLNLLGQKLDITYSSNPVIERAIKEDEESIRKLKNLLENKGLTIDLKV